VTKCPECVSETESLRRRDFRVAGDFLQNEWRDFVTSFWCSARHPLFQDNARYNGFSINRFAVIPVERLTIPNRGEIPLAEDKLYKAEYLGSGTFVISKPKRKKAKMRQTALKNPERGSRK